MRPIEDLTTFRPFNVHETNWDIWDINRFKNDQYLMQNQNKGKIRAHSSNTGGAPSPSASAMSPYGNGHGQNIASNRFNNQPSY